MAMYAEYQLDRINLDRIKKHFDLDQYKNYNWKKLF